MSSTAPAPAPTGRPRSPRDAADAAGPPPGQTRRRGAPSYRWARRILWANLVAQIGIVVTGGVVRLTGSGLGCSTWPQCEPGQFAPVMHPELGWHPVIEFGNRTLTGVLGVLALATAWIVWRERHRARPYRALGLVPLIGVLVQAVVGGLTVLVELHPAFVGVHFMLSMVLIAASTVVLRRHAEGDGTPRWHVTPRTRRLAAGLVPLTVLMIALGVVVTGAGPHSGDLEIAQRLALDPVAVSRVHAAAVWVYVAVLALVVAAIHRDRAPSTARRAAWVLVGVTLAQGIIGYVQFFTGLPEVLVAAHMLGASLLVAAQANQLLALRDRSVEDVGPVVTRG
ncbi:COX15/CtaA family protein [Actinotalea soli]|uniref:COX15/CtaA family protein n=1 Tax=Actinotalea soli TaxID=2819234 RepID=UPI0027DCA56E|nr:COX15/CtaA family protein [Actinotalea soli]